MCQTGTAGISHLAHCITCVQAVESYQTAANYSDNPRSKAGIADKLKALNRLARKKSEANGTSR